MNTSNCHILCPMWQVVSERILLNFLTKSFLPSHSVLLRRQYCWFLQFFRQKKKNSRALPTQGEGFLGFIWYQRSIKTTPAFRRPGAPSWNLAERWLKSIFLGEIKKILKRSRDMVLVSSPRFFGLGNHLEPFSEASDWPEGQGLGGGAVGGQEVLQEVKF